MKRRPVLVLSLALSLTQSLAGPAQAQMLVHDPAAVGQLIAQAQTALNQLQSLREQVGEAQRLYESLNALTDVNSLARGLLAPELRRFLPEIDELQAAASGDLAALGALAGRAQAIRAANRLHAPSAPGPADLILEEAGARAARDLALSETIAEAADARLEGLEELRSALDGAESARAVMEIEARLTAEQALIQNDQMRLQGVLMMQASEARLEAQREKEAAAVSRANRMAMFKRGFEPR